MEEGMDAKWKYFEHTGALITAADLEIPDAFKLARAPPDLSNFGWNQREVVKQNLDGRMKIGSDSKLFCFLQAQ
jgi:hypothetical protein